ncbi:non-homologous end joining protein Ku [Asticcacaulis taihuensis]|uniref:Non-homologous end joining protein Ku n=1 Tax=Asticcacaulis taihuensis TaxID=260084 RepID=A0A1G4TB94_9CAUL|nr:Ku protein [Asticcacaulis taihuensis]SCW78015.1 DNA end-binding protein Ku [Asticcacaulis taihuensis]
MALRPYWSGTIRLSLVSLPVNMYLAVNRQRTIAFHEIYKPTGERVHHALMAGDKQVDRDDLVKGYEVEKGEYVLIEPEEIKELKIPSSKVLDIAEFVGVDEIDDVYIETPYFIAPDGKGNDLTFSVIRDALRAAKKVAVGQLAIGGRERLCRIRPFGSGMVLETLRYEEELREEDPYFDEIRDRKPDSEEVELAQELIKRKTKRFDAGQFHDHYREALQELINARIEHREPREVMEDKPTARVINLMDALRQSLREKDGDEPAVEKEKPARKAPVRSRTRKATPPKSDKPKKAPARKAG